jgi:hypothetical protein
MLRPLRLVWIDVLVVAATSLTFGAIALSQQQRPHKGPPPETIQAMADELGVTADQLDRAAKKALPPLQRPDGALSSETDRLEHRRHLAEILNVSVSRLDSVMEKYRPAKRY